MKHFLQSTISNGAKIEENILLAPQTVFKIGGSARYFCIAETADDLSNVVLWAKEQSVPFVMLGAGSNSLVHDDGYPGLIIKLAPRTIGTKEQYVYADAGAAMAAVSYHALRAGLSGFEWAVGIPGTVGGSVFGNAGCYGSEMKDVVEHVEIFDTVT